MCCEEIMTRFHRAVRFSTVRYAVMSVVVNGTKIANRTYHYVGTLPLGYVAQERVPKGWS